jgi:hypothetical protein
MLDPSSRRFAMRFLSPSIVAVAMLIPSLALAGPGPGQGACKSDVQTLCSGVQPGGGRIRDCMKEHRAQLSAACKIALADRMLERGGRHADGGLRDHAGPPAVGGQASIKPVPGAN